MQVVSALHIDLLPYFSIRAHRSDGDMHWLFAYSSSIPIPSRLFSAVFSSFSWPRFSSLHFSVLFSTPFYSPFFRLFSIPFSTQLSLLLITYLISSQLSPSLLLVSILLNSRLYYSILLSSPLITYLFSFSLYSSTLVYSAFFSSAPLILFYHLPHATLLSSFLHFALLWSFSLSPSLVYSSTLPYCNCTLNFSSRLSSLPFTSLHNSFLFLSLLLSSQLSSSLLSSSIYYTLLYSSLHFFYHFKFFSSRLNSRLLKSTQLNSILKWIILFPQLYSLLLSSIFYSSSLL